MSIKQSDFISTEVSGETHATANTSRKFRFGFNQTPWMWQVLEGNVYVPRHGAGPNDIDVRSDNTSESFRLLLFFN